MAVEIRRISQAEYGEAKALWDVCFPEDASGYSEYYFAHRTSYNYVLAAFFDKTMVGALHAIPYPLKFAHIIKPCVMVAGVATLPQYRHMGIAAKLIEYCHKEQAKLGVVAAVLKPDVDFYARFGYLPFAIHDEYVLTGEPPKDIEPLHDTDEAEMLNIYEEYSKNFVGMMARNKADMVAYLKEAHCTGARAKSNGKAYALYGEDEGIAAVYELVGQENEGLLYALKREYGAVKFRIAKGEKAPKGAKLINSQMFSMLCPLDEKDLIEGTAAKNADDIFNGTCGKINTLEFC